MHAICAALYILDIRRVHIYAYCIYTYWDNFRQELVYLAACLVVWKEAEVLGGNLHEHRENMQTSCMQCPGGNLNHGPQLNAILLSTKAGHRYLHS